MFGPVISWLEVTGSWMFVRFEHRLTRTDLISNNDAHRVVVCRHRHCGDVIALCVTESLIALQLRKFEIRKLVRFSSATELPGRHALHVLRMRTHLLRSSTHVLA